MWCVIVFQQVFHFLGVYYSNIRYPEGVYYKSQCSQIEVMTLNISNNIGETLIFSLGWVMEIMLDVHFLAAGHSPRQL